MAGSSTTKKAAASPKDKAADTATTDSGPGTGVDAPPDTTVRTPAGAPLDPPGDAAGQTQPEAGYPESTTDPVHAANVGRTIAGESFSGIVGADGEELGVDDLFEDPDAGKTFVVTKTRVYEEFYYPGTTEIAKRLLFPQGKRVPRRQAEAVKAAITAASEAEAE